MTPYSSQTIRSKRQLAQEAERFLLTEVPELVKAMAKAKRSGRPLCICLEDYDFTIELLWMCVWQAYYRGVELRLVPPDTALASHKAKHTTHVVKE